MQLTIYSSCNIMITVVVVLVVYDHCRCRSSCIWTLSLFRLQTEVYELRQTIATLKEKIRSAEMTLCRLQKVRSRLETEINAKEKSIQIDKRCCLGMRKYIAVEPKVGPFFLLNNSATAGSTSHMLRCGPHEDVMVGNTQRGCCPLFAGTVCCLWSLHRGAAALFTQEPSAVCDHYLRSIVFCSNQ